VMMTQDPRNERERNKYPYTVEAGAEYGEWLIAKNGAAVAGLTFNNRDKAISRCHHMNIKVAK
jgi:hypothetical protein